jgi:Sec-independent protein translocase protein TatA
MMNFGPIKLLFTAVAALLILGPKRLPAAVRSLGRALGELKRASAEVTEELKSGLDLDTEGPRIGPGAGPTLYQQAPGTTSVQPPPDEELRPGPR